MTLYRQVPTGSVCVKWIGLALLAFVAMSFGASVARAQHTDAKPLVNSPVIQQRDGRTVLIHDGKPAPMATYCDYILWQQSEPWKKRVEQFVKSGVRVFVLVSPRGHADFFDSVFWPMDGQFPAEPVPGQVSLDDQARIILELQPDAKFYIRPSLSPPIDFVRKHIDQMQTDEDGKTYRLPSWSSTLFLEGIEKMLRNLVSYCESRPWADRIIGYQALPYGEGLLLLNIDGKMFDVSACNENAFKQWVKRRYITVEALRESWGRPDATFEAVAVPRDRDWIARRTTAAATFGGKPVNTKEHPFNGGARNTGFQHWVERANVAVEQDYCRFQRDHFLTYVRTITGAMKDQTRALGKSRVVGIDVGKQPMMGWQIASQFDGIANSATFPNIQLLSGSWNMKELLDDPSVDLLWTPADYHARTVGFAYEPEGPADSMVLRGKTFFLENDARTYVGAGSRDLGAFLTPAQVQAGLMRNEALALSRNFFSYWCNVGSAYFDDVQIQKSIASLVPVLDRAPNQPHRETRDAIAFVVDDTSPMYENLTSGFQSIAVIWQRILGLASSGVPYRVLLLSDLERDDFPKYKVYFFPNLFCVDDKVMALLKKKVFRDGNVAIFGPGTGITDGIHLTAEPASKLLGVKMQLFPRSTQRRVIIQEPDGQAAPISSELPAGSSFGDSLDYGPTLVPELDAVEKAGGRTLGWSNTCFYIHRPGLFLRESGKGAAGNGDPSERGNGDYAVLWSCAVPLPSALIRSAARYAGCNIWSETNDVVYASDSFASLHSTRAGPKKLRLPRPMTVTDAMTNEVIGKDMTEIVWESKGLETRMFWLK
jgi:hypothetical protein